MGVRRCFGVFAVGAGYRQDAAKSQASLYLAAFWRLSSFAWSRVGNISDCLIVFWLAVR